MMKKNGQDDFHPPNYREYIQSDAWRAKREQFFASGLTKHCYGCGDPYTKGMHLHHMRYDRLGREYLTDLVVACEKCHAEIHRLEKSEKISVYKATKKIYNKYKKIRVAKLKSRGLKPDGYPLNRPKQGKR